MRGLESLEDTVSKASNSMNAVFLSFAAELLGRQNLAVPYKNTVFEAIGKTLRSYNSKDRGHPGDKETADNWARELNLKG